MTTCMRKRKEKEGKNRKTFTEKVIWTEATLRHSYQWFFFARIHVFSKSFCHFFLSFDVRKKRIKIPTTTIITTTSVIMCFDIFLCNILGCSLFFRLKRLKNYQLLCPSSIRILPLLYFFWLSVQYIHLCVSSSQFFVFLFLFANHIHTLFLSFLAFVVFSFSICFCIAFRKVNAWMLCVYVCEIYYKHRNKLKDRFFVC